MMSKMEAKRSLNLTDPTLLYRNDRNTQMVKTLNVELKTKFTKPPSQLMATQVVPLEHVSRTPKIGHGQSQSAVNYKDLYQSL